ncbi:dienelactone hydrolase family protein [Streptomyces ochraceiscleroticus]|uniref:Dienelactone hydrolase family protein n=1 Tax=Streptomyces ochraceiscleroticus TaxID=47761 RepID=A0ABW1MQX8_9ACTN|nr:alpha/beta family hydrolase [Streptomyces ochraceiscleroticus]
MTFEETVSVPAGGVSLTGDLRVPEPAHAVVVFAHGSGSSRHSPRNRGVAAYLEASGLGTLLMDLLTEEEDRVDEETREHRFDIPLLGERVVAVVDWLGTQPVTERLRPHLFGASTGSAAALVAAAARPERVASVVSRGGRPDLAGDALRQVRAPVLLIVGGHDESVLDLNRQAAAELTAPCHTHVVPGATHLFPESGALDQVAVAARDWFLAPGEPPHGEEGAQ